MTDNTKHDLEKHSRPPKPKSANWYAFWGNKCPVCGAEAKSE